jgi:type II secretory pathway pseudopilin PulG
VTKLDGIIQQQQQAAELLAAQQQRERGSCEAPVGDYKGICNSSSSSSAGGASGSGGTAGSGSGPSSSSSSSSSSSGGDGGGTCGQPDGLAASSSSCAPGTEEAEDAAAAKALGTVKAAAGDAPVGSSTRAVPDDVSDTEGTSGVLPVNAVKVPLPNAPGFKLYCFYGVGTDTERGYVKH